MKKRSLTIIALLSLATIARTQGEKRCPFDTPCQAFPVWATYGDAVRQDANGDASGPTRSWAYHDNESKQLVYVEGTLGTTQQLRYVSMTFALYDADGRTIGTAIDTITGLEAGKEWRFKARALDVYAAKTYRLIEISGASK